MAPDGTQTDTGSPREAYLGIVAATNFKQRVRKMLEYYHADRLNYVVAGHAEPARVRPGLLRQARRRRGRRQADRAPVQVAGLRARGAPRRARRRSAARPPTTDTYSLPQSQEEFYFSLPYDRWTCACTARTTRCRAARSREAAGLTVEQVQRVFRDIDQKRTTTEYLHLTDR